MTKYQFALTISDGSQVLEITDAETDVELGTFTYDDAARILLSSREDAKSAKFTLNQYFIFNTTIKGDDLIRRSAADDADLISTATKGRISPTLEDLLPPMRADGRWEMPAWQFMKVFGPTFEVAEETMIVDGLIELGEPR